MERDVIINPLHYVVKHGSHDQKTHAGGKGGGGPASSGSAGGGGIKGGKNAKKVSTALLQASKNGADKKDVASVKSAYEKKNVEALRDLEQKFFDPAVNGGKSNPHIGLHTATIQALKELDGNSEEFNWQTLRESGEMP